MKPLYLLALFPVLLFSQQKQPVSSLQEDCGVSFVFNTASSGAQATGTFTAGSTGTTPIIDNRQVGCIDWIVTYSPNTAVASVSLAFQIATDVLGVPTTWSNYPGTLNSGINPNTAITAGGAITDATGLKYPFLRMNMTALTGAGATISGRLIGWKRRPTYVVIASGGGCVGTIATPCVVVGPEAVGAPATKSPVLMGGQDQATGEVTNIQTDSFGGVLLGNSGQNPQGEGTNSGALGMVGIPSGGGFNATLQTIPFSRAGALAWSPQFFCANQTPVITLTDATRTQIIAASGSTSIRICHIHFSTSGAAEEFTVSTGTGANCVTGPVVIDDYLATTAIAMDFQPTAALRGAASQAVCVTQSGAAQTAKVVAIYAQF